MNEDIIPDFLTDEEYRDQEMEAEAEENLLTELDERTK